MFHRERQSIVPMEKIWRQGNDDLGGLLIGLIEAQAAEHTVVQTDRKKRTVGVQQRRMLQEQMERASEERLGSGLTTEIYGVRIVCVAQPKPTWKTELPIEVDFVRRR